MPDEPQPNGAALARNWLSNSPFVAHLGIGIESLEPDRAVLSMPFADSLPTLGDVIHGGAISSLIDTSAAAAAWSGAEVPERPRASTVGFSVNFLRPARGQGVSAEARVIRRGGSGLRLRGEGHGRGRHAGGDRAGDLPALIRRYRYVSTK